MDTPKMLSGEELVTRGITTIFATLPEVGMKDVTPNGSWLEQKQVQAALEARKHLVEVERIEKFGTLSQAEWRDDLKLAEVTKHVGSHWQYFGHHVGKKLYITCEEALFLIEVNCLQLKHNGVTMSLQKAYTLLLDDTFTINQYKVYSALSRLGYKVFRHKQTSPTTRIENNSEPINTETSSNDTTRNNELRSNNEDNSSITEKKDECTVQKKNSTMGMYSEKDILQASIVLDERGRARISIKAGSSNVNETQLRQNASITHNEVPSTRNKPHDCVNGNSSKDENGMINNSSSQNSSAAENRNSTEDTNNGGCSNENSQNKNSSTDKIEVNYEKVLKYDMKLQKLESRKYKATKINETHFEELPEMSNTNMVYINIPEDFYIPRNIFVNKTTYRLDLDVITSRNLRPTSPESIYPSSEEENNSLMRIRNTSRRDTPLNTNVTQYYPPTRLPRIHQQFRPFLFWRPRPHFNFINFNMFPSRHYLQNQLHPRFSFHARPNPFLRPYPNVNILDSNNDNVFPRAQKRAKNAKKGHLQAVKNLAAKVKNHILSGNMVLPGNTHIQTIQALHKLLFTYNLKYNTRLRLTSQFDLVGEPNVVETIELDLDDEIQNKRPRLEEDTFNENFAKLREIALKLRNLEVKGISTSRHRRALSAAIKTFNSSYKADVYLQDNYDIVDRRYIMLDSSSESETVVKENKKKQKKKKLRNPFNILKKLSENQSNGHASTSQSSGPPNHTENTTPPRDNQVVLDNWAHWVPKDKDFGRIERCSKNDANVCLITHCEDQLLFDFLKNHTKTFDDWLQIKIEFTKYLKELSKQYEMEREKIQTMTFENLSGLRSIIRPGDCSDMRTLLEKLRIIKTHKPGRAESKIKIDFDVYNRDVQNFRKTNRPKPHFRIVCFDRTSAFPDCGDIAGLHAKHNDEVPTVFAIVDRASVSYIQINPSDLPVYAPNLQ